MFKKNQKQKKKKTGDVLVLLLVIIAIFSVVMPPIISWAINMDTLIKQTIAKEQALQIAEAGINYYQWHLAHFPTDFKDGTNVNGPYVHNYVDTDTEDILGQYSLVITPPQNGSTIVTIASTGSASPRWRTGSGGSSGARASPQKRSASSWTRS